MLNKILNSNSICAKGAIVLGLIVGTLCSSLQTASAGPDTCQEPPSIVKIDPQELLDAIRKVETGGEPNRGIGAVGDRLLGRSRSTKISTPMPSSRTRRTKSSFLVVSRTTSVA